MFTISYDLEYIGVLDLLCSRTGVSEIESIGESLGHGAVFTQTRLSKPDNEGPTHV